jgi:hypothetical protein
MTKRFSKKTLGEYCDNIRGSLIDKNKFNMIDGTHQFLEFFRDKKVSEVYRSTSNVWRRAVIDR